MVLRHRALGVVRFEPGHTTSSVIPERSFLHGKWGQDLFPGKTRLGRCLGDVGEELVASVLFTLASSLCFSPQLPFLLSLPASS